MKFCWHYGRWNMLVANLEKEGKFFLDSGAHSLYNKMVKNNQSRNKYQFYTTQDFWNYVDSYARFVRKYKNIITYYANVDVIYNPEMSWKVQRYLEEEWNLHPIPIVHFGTDMKWVNLYCKKGYYLLGIGGLGQNTTKKAYLLWADRLFTTLCPEPDRLPIIRMHGFAMTSWQLLFRYPWWSVDSSSWTKVGAYGGIFVPHKRKGKFVFTEQPYVISVSQESPNSKLARKHYKTLTKMEQKIVSEWLEFINIPLGEIKDGEIKNNGVMTRHTERKIANLIFFEHLRKSLPKYPWPFKYRERKGIFQ